MPVEQMRAAAMLTAPRLARRAGHAGPATADRPDGGRRHPVHLRLGPLAILAAALLAGCSGRGPNDGDLSRLFVAVKPIEYARILCQRVPMAGRHSCMTDVIEHHRANVDLDLPPDQVTGGPFVAFIDGRLYRGRYSSDPFSAAFSVRADSRVCRGRYSALAGDTRPVFRVRCNDGREGRAQIVLDHSGRNGRGRIEMQDGSGGDIVFGEAAAGAVMG